MPFKSEKQRKWMHANKPKMAKKWEKEKENESQIRSLIKSLVREVLDETFSVGSSVDKKTTKKTSEVLGYKMIGDVEDPSFNMTKTKDKKKRDYKAEYKKYGSSKKAKKYRAELNKYNRKKGTYGNGDGKDASHKGGKIVGFEAQSKNRGRREKSRLKKS